MGFDLKGIKPTGGPIPDQPDWLDDSKYSEMKRKAYFTWQDNTPGAYFRNNVWYWRPLWKFVCEQCDDILTRKDMEEGISNNGHKISRAKAKRIALRLKEINNKLEDFEDKHTKYLKSIPKVDCSVCNGTGLRNDDIGIVARSKNPEYTCNGCSGEGKRDDFETHYPFSASNVRDFAKFCNNSGGFEIC